MDRTGEIELVPLEHRDPTLDCEAIGLELSVAAMALPRPVLTAMCREARQLFRPEQGLIVHGAHGELLATDLHLRELTGMGWLPGQGPAPAGWVLVGPDAAECPPDELPRAVVHRTGRSVLGRCLGLRQPDGAIRWLDLSAHPVRTDDGTIAATITTVRDRDEWGTGAVRASTTADPPTAVAICDPEGRVVSFDEAAAARYPGIAVGVELASVARWNLPPERVARLVRSDQPSWTGTLWMPGPDGRLAPAVLRIVRAGQGDRSLIVTTVEAPATTEPVGRTDEVTGLPQRARFLEALATAVAARDHEVGPVVVVAVGLEGLERVSEGLGHAAADRSVEAAALALRRAAHGADHVARLSDTTFAVCCHHLGVLADVTEYAERLRSSVAEGLARLDLPTTPSCGAGVSVSASPDDDAEALLLQAEIALARPPSADPRRVRRFDDALRNELDRQRVAEERVRHAIASGVVRLGYQPIVRLSDQVVVGAEALLRLLDGAGQPLPAGEAIAVAEERGLIRDLGLLVLEEACREAARWQAALPERFLTIAVNLSARQLADPHLADQVERILHETGLDPGRLKLEMTETVLMEDSDLSAGQLARLKMLGVRLSADDFGTGYSSLAYLKRFPLDAIKADLSFVAGLPSSPADAAVISAIVGVAGALGLRVVAEGVETEAQRRALVELGCDHGQGWLWSKAVEDGGFLERVAEIDAATERVERPAGDGSLDAAPPVLGTSVSVGGAATDAVLRTLAHEVRSPLTVLAGYASMLEADPAQATAVAESMRRAVDRIDGILDRLDDLQAIDLGRLRLEPELVDLDGLVQRVVGDLAVSTPVPIRTEALHVGSALVLADPERIAQVVENLLRNAIRFSPADGAVLVIVSRRGRWVEVAVHDDGPGIPDDQVGLAFRKYGRPDPARSGSGIGLYLARGIARAHGGEVTYRRRPHRSGSVVSLRLPAGPGRLAGADPHPQR